MTEWDGQGRPLRWVTETEPEYDVDERDSWYALAEYEDAICPHCHHLKAICSDPEGLAGEGFYPVRDVCFITAVKEAATRRFRKMHEKAQPDSGGLLPTDGVYVRASAFNEDPEDQFLDTTLDDLVAQALAQREAADQSPAETP